MKTGEISIKTIQSIPAFNAPKSTSAEEKDTKNITDLAKMPTNHIGINTPTTYKKTNEINIHNNLSAEIYKLSNGQKVIILPKKGPTIVKTYVNVGSMNEPDHLRGISHYIEHNLFNGTNDLKAGEFFARVSALGGATNASTSFATTDYYISSQLLKENDLEEKIKLHADMLQNPVFATDMLEKERGPVISEISMVMDVPENLAINRAIKNLYQIQTKSPDLIAGTIDNIKNITREDVLNYYNTHYTPDNFTTVITGDINPSETIKLVSKYFTKQPPQKPLEKKFEKLTPITTPIRVEETSNKATASTIVMAFAGPENNNIKDLITVEALMSILCDSKNSKLRKELEKLHLSIDTGLEQVGNKPNDNVALLFTTNCSKDKTEDALKVIYKEISAIQNGQTTQKEIDIAKKRLNFYSASITENSALLNQVLGSTSQYGQLNYFAERKNIIKNLSLNDIQNAAKKFLNLNKVSIATVNPSEKALKQNNSISFGNKYLKKESFDNSRINTYKLKNNMEITTYKSNADVNTFNIELNTNTPAAIKPGVSLILSKMLNRGTAKKSPEQFSNETEENCIHINFSATPNSISIESKSAYEEMEKALSLAKEVLTSPNLSEENFNFVKEELKETLSKKIKSAADNANAYLFEHLPYSATNEKLLESLENINLEDIKGFYSYIMQNAMGACILNVPFNNPSETLTLFANQLTQDIPKLKPFAPSIFNSFVPLEKNKTIIQADERNQADIVKCFKFKTNNNISDQIKFSLLNIILGGTPNSRLFNDLREKQKLAYRVRSNVEYNGNTGIMSLSIKTTTDNPLEGNSKLDNIKKSLVGFDKNIQKLCNEPVSDEELESAKLYLKTTNLNISETTAGKLAFIKTGKETPYGINYANTLLSEIDKITKEDIQAAAKYIFNTPSLTSIVASKKSLEHFKTNSK